MLNVCKITGPVHIFSTYKDLSFFQMLEGVFLVSF